MWSFRRYGGIMLLLYFVSWIHEWIISSTNKSSLLAISKKSFCNMLWISINHPQQSLSCWGLCFNKVSILELLWIVWDLIRMPKIRKLKRSAREEGSILCILQIFFVPTFPHFTNIDYVVVTCPGLVLVLCDFSFNEPFPLRKN